MYKHVVLWKLKEEANGMSRKELAIEVKRRLDELSDLIPEIVSYETGINIGDYGASFFDVSLGKSLIIICALPPGNFLFLIIL